jgi:hypothetical protein
MDFIINLPKLEGYINIIIIIDRLSKGVITNRLDNLEAKRMAKWFI